MGKMKFILMFVVSLIVVFFIIFVKVNLLIILVGIMSIFFCSKVYESLFSIDVVNIGIVKYFLIV